MFPIHFHEKSLCENTIAKIPFKFPYAIFEIFVKFPLIRKHQISEQNSIEKCRSIYKNSYEEFNQLINTWHSNKYNFLRHFVMRFEQKTKIKFQ